MENINIRTIIKHGGATLGHDGREVCFSNGYQVSKKDCYTLDIQRVNLINKKINKLLKTLNRGEFVGIWVNDGKVYVDVSIRIRKREKAIAFGKALKQLAVYDWATGDCIACNA